MQNSWFVSQVFQKLGRHPHLINLVATVTASDPICIVTDLCVNGDLLQYVRRVKENVNL
jgi:hypothetical protein